MTKRFFIAIFLLAAAATTYAAEDAHTIFKRMWDADQLHKGMNLIQTYPNGQKLWADLKADNGYAIVNWVVTDAAGKQIPSVVFNKRGQRESRILNEIDKCTVCDPDGKNCKVADCPMRVPCCSNHHWCCIH
jgi:hypothetical protein